MSDLSSSIAVPAELLRQHFPGKVCTEFKSWRSVTWSEYKAAPTTQLLRESGVVTQQHLLFIAVFERKHGEFLFSLTSNSRKGVLVVLAFKLLILKVPIYMHCPLWFCFINFVYTLMASEVIRYQILLFGQCIEF